MATRRTRFRILALVVLLALTPLWAPRAAFGQDVTATLRGHVYDHTGSPLPGVPVTVESRSRGGSARTAMTDLEGVYKLPLLPPASDYFLVVSYPGFATTEVGPVDLDAGRTTLLDVRLEASADLTERIEVVGHGNVVDTTSTKSSTTFNTEFVEGLPIIGRNFQDILTLTPGVTDTDGDGNPNVQGSRETGLQYRLDGGNITDPVSGTLGQTLNIDAIEEIEVITAGAGAEFGRADGGFANIITKSGGNDFQGTFRLFWRGRILDGDGAGENSDLFLIEDSPRRDVRDLSAFLTLGGAFRKDRLWYFVSFQSVDRIDPLNLAGYTIERTEKGNRLFGKVTWQADADNKLALQYSQDPRRFTGEFLDVGVSSESDADLDLGSRTTQLRWTSIISPTLLMEALLTHYQGGVAVTPVSSRFHRTEIGTQVVRFGGLTTIQAEYPVDECLLRGRIPAFSPPCDPRLGNPSIYQVDIRTGLVTGPYPERTDDQRSRRSIRADFTHTLEERWGEHQIKVGLEFADERFHDEPTSNSFFVNNYEKCEELCPDPGDRSCPRDCFTPAGAFIPGGLSGFQVLSSPSPVDLDQSVESFNSAIYLQDTWKPVPNLTLQAGLRLDREDIDTSGFTEFHPRDEKRRSIGIVESLCDDGIRVARTGNGNSNADFSLVCDDPTRIRGEPPKNPLRYEMDSSTPTRLRQYDTNLDGFFDSGVDGAPWFDPFSNFLDRKPENFTIDNTNLSPRFSISWDPWADGRTKVFATWGRYFDRLFLDTVDDEIGPDVVNYIFLPDANSRIIEADDLSTSASAGSLSQVDRNLRTPFTDVFTLGLERELAPEWAARLVYTQRLGWDLLQDVDLNHLTCDEFPAQFNIRRVDVCRLFTDSTGKIHTSDDLFGNILTQNSNGAPDLYNINPNFNQVLRIGNLNSSSYRSATVEIIRRLHRSWQGRVSYTFSRAYGQAEEFGSSLGNDPSTKDDEQGYLDYDQRHRVVLVATSLLPREIEIGTSITWESGTPYSVIAQAADADDDGNVAFRTFYPTGVRNDQRNDGFWGVDLKVVKRFNLGNTAASASLAVNNLLNDDDATLSAFRTSSFTGVQLLQGPQGLRRFGRYWELGFHLAF